MKSKFLSILLFWSLGSCALGSDAFAGTRAKPSVCDRTPEIKQAIMKQISSFWRCEEVSNEMLSQIRALHVEWAAAGAPAPGDLNGLSSLRSLRFSERKTRILNEGRTLKAGLFRGLEKLEELSLAGFSIVEIQPKVFEGLSKLIQLDLSQNRFTRLPKGAFQDLARLEKLLLVGNPIQELELGTLQGLWEVTELDLSKTDIESIDDGVLESLEVLEKLNLSYTKLKDLDARPFLPLRKLTWLGMTHTPIKEFNASFLEPLPKRMKLDLSHSKLSDASYCKATRYRAQVQLEKRSIQCRFR